MLQFRGFGCLALGAVMTACSGGPGADSGEKGAGSGPGIDPADWSVLERGPYGLGYRELETTYTTALGTPRTIPVHVWYPTEDDLGASPGDEVRYDGLFAHDSAIANGSLAPAVHANGYPVVVHSHGHWGVAGGVAFWADRLVSQGFVVVAPGHVGNTFSEGFPDFSGDSPTAHYIERPQDASAALDALAAGELLDGDFQLDAVGLSGHSRGAYTAWSAGGGTFDAAAVEAACTGASGDFPTGTCTPDESAVFLSGDLADDRFRAILTLDGGIRGLFGDAGHTSMHGPVMAMRKPDDGGADQAEFDRMEGLDYTWISVEGACHESFNLGIEVATLGPCETLDQQRGWDLTATYAFAFFRRHLLADDGAELTAILDGSTEVDPAVTLQRR